MTKQIYFVDSCEETHFQKMSLLHALGWRTAYRDSIPADYMAREITDGRWVPVFRQNYEEGVYRGLLLYDGDRPLCCATYGPARVDQSAGDTVCSFSSPDRARRFYEKHGFAWDGHSLDVALTPETVLTDLRYCKAF